MVSETEKPLAAGPAAAQNDHPTQQNDVIGRAPHDRKRRRPTSTLHQKIPPRAELLPFAERVDAAMKAKGMNASDVAREIWGTTKNKRGNNVARNRDRIGHYLAATSYPEPENLRRLAEALDLPIEELEIERPAPERSSSRRSIPGPAPENGLSITALPAAPLTSTLPSRYRVQIDRVIPNMELLVRLLLLLEEAKSGEHAAAEPDEHEPGKVINGGKV